MTHRMNAVIAIATTLTALLALPARAEVRAVQHASHGWSVRVTTGEGGGLWTPVPAHDFGPDLLNPGGDVAGHGDPAYGIRPVVGLPEAVWSVPTAVGHDIVHARHDGERWLPAEPIVRDMQSSDLQPRLAFDDSGRAMLAWKKVGNEDDIIVAGLSGDGRLWGQRPIEGQGWQPVAMSTDGADFYFASVHLAGGRLRFKHVAFPFPNGGPALPFPDDALVVTPLVDELVGADMPSEPTGDPDETDDPARTTPLPASLAAATLQVHRDGERVWTEWVTTEGTLRWFAFDGTTILDDGEEPYGGPNQVGPTRERIRRIVSEL